MSEIVDPDHVLAADAHSATAPKSIIHQIWNQAWPWVMVALGLAFTTAWTLILVYGLFKIIELAI